MTITIIDKYPIIRSGLRISIINHFADVTCLESKSIEDFNSDYSDVCPDIFIMALSQDNDVDNIEIIKVTKKLYDLRTIIFYDEEFYPSMLSQYFKAGARYYLSKTSSLNELFDCISVILKGKYYVKRDARSPLKTYSLAEKADLKNSMLTTKEYEIAKYLSEGRKISWIAQKLDRKSSTISTSKARIFKKLLIENILELRDLLN